jgi:NADPH:quinone reductase-like Zn-dependent oxidoreductase
MAMRVIEVTRAGGPEVLQVAERPDPTPGPGEAVVRIAAANVNPTDLGARTGHGPRAMPDPPYVLGWDFAGEVVAVGEGDPDVSPGDRVVGMIHWYDGDGQLGAYAEQVGVPADWLVPLPNALEMPAAATIPLNALTAAQGLELLDLPEGASLLVTGASGAVGSFAVQLAKAAGLRVLAQASTGDEDWVRGLGADEVLARDVDFASVTPVDGLFDAVPVGEAAYAAVRDGGVAVSTRRVPEPDPSRGIRQQVFLIHPDVDRLAQLVDDTAAGWLKTRVDRVLPLEQAAEAHRLNEAGGLRGKVVLAP